MARTVGEVYDRIITAMNNLGQVNGLDPNPDSYADFQADLQSTSKVARHRIFIAGVAVVISTAEKLIEQVRVEIEKRLRDQGIGQLNWYVRLVKKYRHGYQIQFINNEYQFSQTAKNDSAAAIVKRASAVDQGGAVRVKVAKLDSNDNPQALTNNELQGVQNYLSKIKPAGINVQGISAPPDELRLELQVYYDPTILQPTGELITNPNVKPVDEAINGYIFELPFDGVFNLNEMMSGVYEAKGVADSKAYLWKAEARPDGASQWDALFDVTATGPDKQQEYRPLAGHLEVTSITVDYVEA